MVEDRVVSDAKVTSEEVNEDAWRRHRRFVFIGGLTLRRSGGVKMNSGEW